MSKVFGKYGPAFPRLGKLAHTLMKPLADWLFVVKVVYAENSRYTRKQLAAMTDKLSRGETVYLVGTCPSGHNSGVALIEVSAEHGIRLLSNDEEERFVGIKHFGGYPHESVEALKKRMADLGITPRDIHAWVASWDYTEMAASGVRLIWEHLPWSLELSLPSAGPNFNWLHAFRAGRATGKLGEQLGLPGPVPIIGLSHHDNHAAFSYAVSPFNRSDKPVIVTVIDGFGDRGAISLYVAEKGQLRLLRGNENWFDSLGVFYSILSSTQGGWTTLSSEGRYMGAAAWGDSDRLTNPYYRRLRQIFYFGPEGEIHVNRAMANWFNAGERRPYNRALKEVAGEPVPQERMWNPDAVLRVEDVEHSDITRDRVDLAAATQLVFEDGLFHVVDHLIRETGSDQLVLTGGTALNCIANMRLLERFDEEWYRRNLGRNARLHIWVPPTPGDAGAGMGAAYNFALKCGAKPGEVLQHAYYCGRAPSTVEIQSAPD